MILRLVLLLALLTGCSMIGGVAYGEHTDVPICQPGDWGWWLIAPGNEEEPAKLYKTTQNLQMDFQDDGDFTLDSSKIFCVEYPLAPIMTMGPSKMVKIIVPVKPVRSFNVSE